MCINILVTSESRLSEDFSTTFLYKQIRNKSDLDKIEDNWNSFQYNSSMKCHKALTSTY